MPYYIHKHEVSLAYGGPEEGGWWYEEGTPVSDSEWETARWAFTDEDKAYEKCRELNEAERERAKKEEQFEYSSVLAYKSTHYSYRVEEFSLPKSYPDRRPHYE